MPRWASRTLVLPVLCSNMGLLSDLRPEMSELCCYGVHGSNHIHHDIVVSTRYGPVPGSRRGKPAKPHTFLNTLVSTHSQSNSPAHAFVRQMHLRGNLADICSAAVEHHVGLREPPDCNSAVSMHCVHVRVHLSPRSAWKRQLRCLQLRFNFSAAARLSEHALRACTSIVKIACTSAWHSRFGNTANTESKQSVASP